MKINISQQEFEFLQHSNWIEKEDSNSALEDAVSTWCFAKEYKEPINIPFIKEIHQNLMKRINPLIAGKIRRCPIYVGNSQIGYEECLKPELIQKELSKWAEEYSNPKEEENIKQAHIKLLKIHPFEDGNGRTGRIVMNYQRLKAQLPILIIHKGQEQFEYYKWFK
ncbi:MAG: Fic family protein [Nanoarchaeota archaeon]|nr:Fic family protein [Nanoarchaeota archaeon]